MSPIGYVDVFKKCPTLLAAASGLLGGGHPGSAEAGDGSRHLQQGRRAARLQSLETRAFPSRCSLVKNHNNNLKRIIKHCCFVSSPLKAEGPVRKVRKSLVLDLWGKDCLSDQQVFEEQLNIAQVSRNKDVRHLWCDRAENESRINHQRLVAFNTQFVAGNEKF